MLSTDSTFHTNASFSSTLRNPLTGFYRPSRFGSNVSNFSNKNHPFDEGLNFFGKLTSSQFDNNNSYEPSLNSNRFRFREFFAREHEQQEQDRFLKNLDNSRRNDSIRYDPYSSASKNHRLRKILYKSVANIDDLSPLPNKYVGFTMHDKLAHLRKTIRGFDTTNFSNKENSNFTTPAVSSLGFRNLDSTGFGTALPKRFSPPNTSTPLATNQINNLLRRPRPFVMHQQKSEPADKIVPQSVPEETPSSSRKVSTSITSECSNSEKPSLFSTGVSLLRSVQQLWRGKRFNEEIENRKKEAQSLEKELRLREKSRHNRELTEEENRRVRLQLEGLVLERRVPPKEEFPELKNADKQIVKIIWSRSMSLEEVFVSGFDAKITRKDLLTLSNLEWLNDEVINFFLNLVVERNNSDPNLPKVFTFNTFFYQKLQKNGFTGVKRWTRKVDIFAHEILIIPIHLPNHWCMAIIDFRQKRLDYYDSLMGTNEKCLHNLRDYLEQESLDKRKRPFDSEGWIMECRKDIPSQSNFSDCGMFSCLFAEYASRRAPITFTQKHISYFRERMCFEIYQKNLL
ncbi:hypothetical protein niasHT_023193 [Heterodera trifolii]|uniref:Ubiquitin-like protease family profile domain-containing protein n=1 Tax=Heterodera trifolii TaxID=157864 RepID=A0ABD2JD88_9BILA